MAYGEQVRRDGGDLYLSRVLAENDQLVTNGDQGTRARTRSPANVRRVGVQPDHDRAGEPIQKTAAIDRRAVRRLQSWRPPALARRERATTPRNFDHHRLFPVAEQQSVARQR